MARTVELHRDVRAVRFIGGESSKAPIDGANRRQEVGRIRPADQVFGSFRPMNVLSAM